VATKYEHREIDRGNAGRRFCAGSGIAWLTSHDVRLTPDEIRKQTGDRKFFALLRAWVQQHRNVEADQALFVSWLKRYTGRNLAPRVCRL
jgi:hypothetical protein